MSPAMSTPPKEVAGSVAADQLRSYVARIEAIEEEIAEGNALKSDIYKDAKGAGFDVKVLRKVIADRRKDYAERIEFETIYDLYVTALEGRVRAHVEPKGEFDPETGEIIEPGNPGTDLADTVAELRAVSAEYGVNFDGYDAQDREFHEPQSPSAAPDLTSAAAPSDAGQVEHIQPETASDHATGAPTSNHNTGGLNENARPDPDLVNPGRRPSITGEQHQAPEKGTDTAPSESAADEISQPHSPATATVVPVTGKPGAAQASPAPTVPGEVRFETCQPKPVRWHEFVRCFPEHWGMSLAGLADDIRANGVRDPIVKIGDYILDGRARYNAARQLGIAYPVVEYVGTDALADVIRWNLETRKLSAFDRKAIAARLMRLPSVAHRASEIAAMFELEVETA